MTYALVVMSKSPVLGTVKTRMQPYLSVEQSVELHTQLTQYCLQHWIKADFFSVQLWVGGDIELFKARVLSNNIAIPIDGQHVFQQVEGDLGLRMSYAINTSLKNYPDGVFVVGTDCPFIDVSYFRKAIEALENYDVVIGPASDGGYVLIGMKADYPFLFENIEWGTSSVYRQTKVAIEKNGLTCFSLPVLSDIDCPEDLKKLVAIDAFSFLDIKPLLQ